MKSSEMKKATKRILAMLLCTSMVLGSGVSASADEGMAAVKEQGHVHTETCYEKNKTDNLICTKAEAAEGHVHGDECYEVTSNQELTCTQAETAGHTHGDSCMETTKNLICGKEEHTHGGDCYKTETKDVCSDESEEHTCGDGCVETEEVLKCEKSEHTHDDGCYESETKMVCGQNEVEAHTHGEGCYTTAENKTLKCTLEEVEAHTHNDECYAWEETLVCTVEEGKPAQETEAEDTQKSAEAQKPAEEQKNDGASDEEKSEKEPTEVNLQNDDETGIKVSVKSTSDVIPEDTKVVVASMEMDEEHEAALAEAVSEFEVLGYTAYDISLKDAEDEDITLGENKVEVAIDLEEAFPEGINAEEVKDVVLVHITTDEEEKLTAETVGTVEITEEKATVEFEADSFSPYVVTYLSEAEEAVEEVVVEEPVVEDVVLTYTSEDEAYTVTVTGTPEVLENVAAFEAVPVIDEGKITALTKQLTAKAAEMQKTSLGFENYEFKFLDAEGNEAAVNGEVKVALSFAEEKIPEAATAENVDAVDAALLKTGTDDKGEAVLEEINGLVSAEAGAVKEVVYTTEAPEELILAWSGDVYRTLPNYEDDEIVITLAGTEYALQNVVGFNVTPIKEDNEETKEQYAEVAKQLDEKIAEENEAKEVVGFLAYDITLVDTEGNELEPQGGVRVSMEYKEAAAPEAVAEAEEAEVTIHHFEEDEKGEVKQIVDMVAEETIEAEVTTTMNAEVEKVEFVTDSFSTYTITWTWKEGRNNVTLKLKAQVVDTNGNLINGLNNVKISVTKADREYVFNKVNCADIEVDTLTFGFVTAKYSSTSKFSNAQDIYSVKGYNADPDRVQYRISAAEQWIDVDAVGTVYLVYETTTPYVDVTIVDSERVPVVENKKIPLEEDEIYEFVSDDLLTVQNGDYTYTYHSAYVEKKDGSQVTISGVKYDSEIEKYYIMGGENTPVELEANEYIYLLYSGGPGDKLTRIQTVDHASAGVVMKMFDYTIDGESSPNYTTSQKTSFMNIEGGWDSGKIRYNLLKSKLAANGYPETKEGTNLGPIFGGGGTVNGGEIESSYTVNHLFSQDVYNATGYYEYSSFNNYAYLDRKTGNFIVYDQIGTPEETSSTDYLYNRGNFFPYNNIKAGELSQNTSKYNEDGGELSIDKIRPLYATQTDSNTEKNPNYYFGMYIEAQFIQPEDGMVEWNGTISPMRYEFNGDDDLWVYIDNALLLDIGGIHVAHRGYIDFSTGEIGWYDGNNNAPQTLDTTTIKAMYEEAGLSTEDFVEIKDANGNGTGKYRFADYSPHTMKMFYMERGDGASDLHVKFNLPIVPRGAFEVKKELTNTDKEKYANVEFAYQAFAQEIISTDENGVETYSDRYVPLREAVYKGTENQVEFESGVSFDTKDKDGNLIVYDNVFYLKPDETVRFSGLQENRKYYVVEVGVNAKEFDKVVINGVGHQEFDENEQSSGVIEDVETEKVEVSKRPYVLYQNNCSSYNLRELRITKSMAPESNSKESFAFKVELETTAGSLQSYKGGYYLQDSDGNYYKDENGSLVNCGSNATVCGRTDNGVIPYVKVGYTASITQILSGTQFRVTEYELNSDKYGAPKFEVKQGTAKDETIMNDYAGYAQGTILLGTNAEVTITNSFKVTKQWELIKKSSSGNKTLGGAKFVLKKGDTPIYYGLSVDDGEDEGKVIWYNNVDCTDTAVTNIPDGSYIMSEIQAPSGYSLSDEYWTIVMKDGAPESIVSSTKDSLTLTPTDKTEDGKTIKLYTLYFENEALYELPSTGGHGIYTTMLSGFALMLGAAYVWFTSRREESSNN